MNKEQIDAMLADGEVERACVAFADTYGIEASDLEGFVARVMWYNLPRAGQ